MREFLNKLISAKEKRAAELRELIKKAEEELNFYEQKLHLAQRFGEAGEHAAALRALAVEHKLPDEVISEIRALEECIS